MPISDQKELGLTAAVCHPNVSLVPIKKRFPHLLSSPYKELVKQDCLSPNDGSYKDVAKSDFSLPSEKNNLTGKLNDLQHHEMGCSSANIVGMSFANATASDSRQNIGKELKIDCNLSAKEKTIEQPDFERNINREFASNDKLLFQKIGMSRGISVSSAMYEKVSNNYSVKLEKDENPILNESLAGNLKYPTSNTYPEEYINRVSDSNRENRANWDLNVTMDTWHAARNDPGVKQEQNDKLNEAIVHQKKIHTSLVHSTTSGLSRNNISGMGFGLSIAPKRNLSSKSLSNLSVSDTEKNYELGLDLQLKPPSLPELHIDLGDTPPDLSLSLTGDSNRSQRVKQELCEDSLTESQLCAPMLVSSDFVKTEPSDVSFTAKAMTLDACHDHNSKLSQMVKPELSEEFSQECIGRVTGKLLLMYSCNNKTVPLHAEVRSNSAADTNSVSSSDKNMQSNNSSVLPTTKSRNSVENKNAATNEYTDAERLLKTTCIRQDIEDDKAEASSAIRCVVSNTQELDSYVNTSDKATDLVSNLVLGSKLSDGKETTICDGGKSQGSQDMDFSDCEDTLMSNQTIVEVQMHVHQGSLGGEVIHENLGSTAQVQNDVKELSNAPISLNNFRDRNHNNRLGYNEVDDCENNDASVHGALKGTNNKRELVPEVNGTETVSVRNLDVEGKQIELYEKTQADKSFDKCDDVCNVQPVGSSNSTKDIHETVAVGKISCYDGKMIKSLQSEKKGEQINNNDPLEMESRLARANAPRGMKESDKGNIVTEVEAKELSVSSKYGISSAGEIGATDPVKKHGDDGDKQGRINEASVVTSVPYGRGRPIYAWPRGRLTGKYTWQDSSSSQGNRNERYSVRPLKFQNHDKMSLPNVKHGPNFINSRRDHDRLDNSHYRRNPNHRYPSEFNKSKYHQYARPGRSDISLNANDNTDGGNGRLVERPLNIETPDLSHFSNRRWSPRSREAPLMLDPRAAGAAMRDVTPNMFIPGDALDAPPLAGEDEVMREMPDEYTELTEDYMDPSPYPHHHLQYGGQRRSISPIPRRGPPMHLPRVRSPRRWSPSERALDTAFDNNPQGLIRGRSPRAIRFSRHSPQPAFVSEDGNLVRRPSSPPYSQLPCNIDEMHTTRELDYRALPRPIRRFGQEPDDGYFENYVTYPPAELAEEFFDRREFNERRFIQPFGQPPIGAVEDECLPYPVNHGPRRPMRFCTEENFHDRVSMRNGDGRIRNRTSNMANRLRGMAEQDRIYHETSGFHEDDYSDVRPKRRRF